MGFRKFSTIALGLLSAALVNTASAFTVVGVTDDNTVVTFDTGSPNTLDSGKALAGLAVNESVRGIDYRPVTGELYALGSFGNIYTLTISGPVAVANFQFNVNTAPAFDASGNPTVFTGLNGASFGFDFNPSADFAGGSSLRIVSNQDQNLAVNVNTGTVTVATPVSYGGNPNPNIVGEAYSNSIIGGNPNGTNPAGQAAGNGTTQYAIDSGTDGLVLQAFNAGILTTVGALGTNTTAKVGFDILSPSINSNFAFATLDSAGTNTSRLYRIDLGSGAATDLGEIGGGLLIPNISLVPIPEPGTLILLASGGAMMLMRRRQAK